MAFVALAKTTKFFNARPVIFRAHPILFVLCLAIPWIGWLFLVCWLFDNAGTRIEVTATDVTESKWFGLAAKRVDVPLCSIQAVDVEYGLRGMKWNAGRVALQLKNGERKTLSAIESPGDLKTLIDKLRA